MDVDFGLSHNTVYFWSRGLTDASELELWEVIIPQSSNDHKLLKLVKMLDKENSHSVKNFNPGQRGRLLPSCPFRKLVAY